MIENKGYTTSRLAEGLNDETDTELRDAYTLNVMGGLKLAGIPTRGPGAPGTPGGFKS